MNNQEYVKKIVSYIRSYMEQNNITQKKLDLYVKKKTLRYLRVLFQIFLPNPPQHVFLL